MLTCTSLFPRFSSNAHHHGSLPQQLEGGLRPAPESRSRGAFPHLSRSLFTRLVHNELVICVLLQHTLSRPAEFHHRPLAEPSVRLSPHSAPIRQTCRPYGLSVTRIEVLPFPVASGMRPPDPTPSLQLHYEPSSLLRVGPPQGSASVRSPRGCRRLGFSLRIRATGSCSSAQQPASASRPLDRKSTRLNSSHVKISYAVFCLKKKIIRTRPVSAP